MAFARGGAAVFGHVREVAYLGQSTRFVVEVEGGGELLVVEQNLDATSMEALAARGQRVRLAWDRGHLHELADG